MRAQIAFLVVAALFGAFTITTQPSALADTFGSGGNTFDIKFVNIGDVGNSADTATYNTYGAVAYEYRMGKYEISQDDITKATASGMANVTAGAWTGSQPAANISWYEAAAFVNWLNTSTGKTAAYDLAWDGSAWSMNLWSSGQAWTAGGENLYRNKNAFYFLPSENEWYKAAYYNPAGSNYFLYPTASDIAPTPAASGTNAGTAVFEYAGGDAPTDVQSAGGLSALGTMAQGGNLFEWTESASDLTNDIVSEFRAVRGGAFNNNANSLDAFNAYTDEPSVEYYFIGFRVAAVPEPSTYALLAMSGAGALWLARRRR
jgi:hypothetical protein